MLLSLYSRHKMKQLFMNESSRDITSSSLHFIMFSSVCYLGQGGCVLFVCYFSRITQKLLDRLPQNLESCAKGQKSTHKVLRQIWIGGQIQECFCNFYNIATFVDF